MDKILEIWNKTGVKQVTTSFEKEEIKLSDKLINFINRYGLPLIDKGNGLRFLPFTYFPSVKIEDEKFYLIGDYSRNFIGISFVGINLNTEKIYDIYLKQNTCSIINQSLYQFLQCLYYYNAFWQKYDGSSEVVSEEIKKDYEQLQLDLTQVDAQAMSQRDYFWKHRIEVMEVSGYGDYLTGRELPVMENPPTFTQDEIDNMDLPF